MSAGSAASPARATEVEDPDVSVLIVNFNTRDVVLPAIESVFAETQQSVEVICVDNDSDDGSAEAIAERFPEVRLIRSPNVGFAAGNNLAAQHARGRRLLLLNPDTLVRDRALDHLLAFADRRPDAGIWGGRTVFGDGSLNPTSCWGRMTPWSLFCRAVGLTYVFPRSERFNSESMGGWRRDTERRVDIVTGCFFMIDRSLWERLDGFNVDFFMYGEEADLCHRAEAVGAQPRITPEATIVHYGGGSERSSADKLVKTMRGKVTIMNVHWSPPARWFGKRMFLLLVTVRALANLIMKPRRNVGAGLDARTDVWRSAYKRRREWLDGWPLTRLGGASGQSRPAATRRRVPRKLLMFARTPAEAVARRSRRPR